MMEAEIMGLTVALISIAAMLFIFIPIAAVDRFNVQRNKKRDAVEQKENRTVLIYGKSGAAELLEAEFARRNMEYDHVSDELLLSSIKIYGEIFIVGSDDFDNLLMSSKLELRYPGAEQVLLCNDTMYSDVYKKTGKKFLTGTDSFRDMPGMPHNARRGG